MATENLYTTPINFSELAKAYPSLHKHLFMTPRGLVLNFKDVGAQRCLTEALLYRDFGRSLALPAGRLCPAVPNRYNYVRWIRSVVQEMEPFLDGPVYGLDIGTGASAIYPLLITSLEPSWNVTGTDIDPLSLEYAALNVERNGLFSRIRIAESDPEGKIFHPLHEVTSSQFAFTMCNPPFYASKEEVAQSAELKDFDPHAVCTGADVEMITTGGEVTFVLQMLDESFEAQDRCMWFTSMLGKLSSVAEIVKEFRSRQVDNYALTELVQGSTRRWVIAWSFGPRRLPDIISRPLSSSLRSIVPLPNTLHQSYTSEIELKKLLQITREVVTAIGETSVSTSFQAGAGEYFVAQAGRNTWSRAARRGRNMPRTDDPQSGSTSSTGTQLICSIQVKISQASKDKSEGRLMLVGNWVSGRSRPDFESFWSHVTRKVDDRLKNSS